jgi:hypothetical protein
MRNCTRKITKGLAALMLAMVCMTSNANANPVKSCISAVSGSPYDGGECQCSQTCRSYTGGCFTKYWYLPVSPGQSCSAICLADQQKNGRSC